MHACMHARDVQGDARIVRADDHAVEGDEEEGWAAGWRGAAGIADGVSPAVFVAQEAGVVGGLTS